ncbi:signal peptidase I [Lactococcus ileimucosae]|uniref:signal peptidase I n=1 Tax=Lactococcus ileimucosae TaxID=2941329 RepID=UPI00204433EC|nr:signal peptidase I [Lactococcus ileimucosae]
MNKTQKGKESVEKVIYHDLSGGEDFATAACDFPEDIQAIQDKIRARILATESRLEASKQEVSRATGSFEKQIDVRYPSSRTAEPAIVLPPKSKEKAQPIISAQSVLQEPSRPVKKVKKEVLSHEVEKEASLSQKQKVSHEVQAEEVSRQEGTYKYYYAQPKEAKHYPTIVVNKLTVSTAPRSEFYGENKSTLNHEEPKKDRQPSKGRFKLKPQSKAAGLLGNTIFYLVIIVLLVFLESQVILQNENDRPVNLAGFSPMTVLSNSMQSVYPKGTFLLTRQTDPNSLNIGDDITFVTEANRTVTHRVVGIEEDYLRTRERGFVTKGVDNERADTEVVHASNVVGRVIFSSYPLGRIVQFVREHLIVSVILMLVFMLVLHEMLTFLISRRRHGSGGRSTPRRTKPKRRTKRRKSNERKVLSHEAI